MSEWKSLTDESRKRWDSNAIFWDHYMGENNNRFYNELIKPTTEKLLEVKQNEKILDIACGHGNFSRRLAELQAMVIAIDFSSELIERAKSRSLKYQIDYRIIDATDYNALINLGITEFDSAVANMALMDMSEIKPLSKALAKILKNNGKFVFSVIHPCFQNPGLVKVYEEREVTNQIQQTNSIKISHYIKPESYEGIGIRNQPISQLYFHRPLSLLLNYFFEEGFMLDKMEEPVFHQNKEQGRFEWNEIPAVIICRLINKKET